MKALKLIVLLITVLMLASSCTALPEQHIDEPVDEPATDENDAESRCIELFYKTDGESKAYLGDNLIINEEIYNQGHLFATYHAELPQFAFKGNPDSANAINIYYQGLYKETEEKIQTHAATLLEEVEGLEPFSTHYYLNIDFAVKIVGGYINVLLFSEEYFGWLHPQNMVHADVFNKTAGEKVTLSDLFCVDEEEYLTKLTNEIYIAFRKESDYRNKYSLDGTYEEEQMQVHVICKDVIIDGNFYCDEDGIVILFNTYSIASYASGPAWVKIPYSSIDAVLKDSFARAIL